MSLTGRKQGLSISYPLTNARSEGLNSKIQWIKRKACGYRNRKRFHNAIYFHLADLDLSPDPLRSTHTKT